MGSTSQYAHSSKSRDSSARQRVEEILSQKGASPRYYKNLLVFLTADKNSLATLEQNVCQFLAWNSIVQDKDALNLDVFQSNQATTKRTQSNEAVERVLKETYQWSLVPTQPVHVNGTECSLQSAIEWIELRLQGQESPILRASRKLVHEEHLIVNYAASRLCMEALDPFLWREADHLDLKRLWEYLAQYLYLPRLKNEQVLLQAIQEGVSSLLWHENFAHATGWDAARQRYLGLKAGPREPISVTLSNQSLLVKPAIAQNQFELDEVASRVTLPKSSAGEERASFETENSSCTELTRKEDDRPSGSSQPKPQRFYGSVQLDALRFRRDAGQIADEVLQHFTSLVETEVEITLDIQVRLPDGVPDHVLRTITENCRVLKFTNYGFEDVILP